MYSPTVMVHPKCASSPQSPTYMMAAGDSGMDEDGDVTCTVRPEGGELSLAFRPLVEIPEEVAQRHGPFVFTLNLIETSISSLATLRYFTHLRTLILDNNGLERLVECPVLESVTTLWFNNNKVFDLPAFLDDVLTCFPSLAYLSMMRNPASGLIDIVAPDVHALRLYRSYTLYRMPSLQLLDCTPVTNEERQEAAERGQFAARRKPKASNEPVASNRDAAGLGRAADTWEDRHAPESENTARKAAYLGVARRRYDGRHSEGNRFITNVDL